METARYVALEAYWTKSCSGKVYLHTPVRSHRGHQSATFNEPRASSLFDIWPSSLLFILPQLLFSFSRQSLAKMEGLNSSVLRLTPAMRPPPGVIPNLLDPSNDLLAVSVVTWTICMTVVLCSVSIRLFTKCRIMKKPEYGDCKFSIHRRRCG